MRLAGYVFLHTLESVPVLLPSFRGVLFRGYSC
jgi:hypothetical protein